MNKIKAYEAKGYFEESLKLVKQLQNIQKDIMQMNNSERR
jgi:DNA primase